MANKYLQQKARNNAGEILKHYDIGYAEALKITTRLWDAARSAILKQVTPEEWQALSPKDRALVCHKVVQALMDKKKLAGFLAGDRARLV